MKLIPVVLISGAIGVAGIGVFAKLSPASAPWAAHEEWERRHAGPDSSRVASFLDALGKTDPVVCEMIGDQVGNFWSGGEEAGIGRLSGANMALRAAKDSIGGAITEMRAINRLVAELGAPNACVRRVASKMLGRSDITPARLNALLSDASPLVREAAAYAVGNGNHHAALPSLVKALDDRVPAVAAMSAWALGAIEDHAALAPLVKAAHADDARVRASAIWALGQLEDEHVVADVLPALRDANSDIRVVTVEVLGKLKNAETIAPLEQALASDGDARVRAAAAAALGEIASERSGKALGVALHDRSIEVQRAAASALGELHDFHHAPDGLVLALQSSDAELRHIAARTVCALADPLTTQTILGLLSAPDRDLRKSAVEALGEIGSKDAVSGLTRALGDKDPEVRKAAVEALGEIKG